MPGKSWQGRRRHSARGKKRKVRRSPVAVVVQQQAVAPIQEVATPSKVSAPAAARPTPRITVAAVQQPFVVNELRRIGILTGIMLAILVVLSLVLS